MNGAKVLVKTRMQWALGALLLASLLVPASCRRQRFSARGDAAAVVVVTPRRDAASPPSLAEVEPNDTLAQAQSLGVGSESASFVLEASLPFASDGKVKDVDVYKLVVPGTRQEPAKSATEIDAGAKLEDWRFRAQRLSVAVTRVGCMGSVLQLLDESGKLVEGVSLDASSAGGGMPNLAVLPGATYFIQVKARGKPAKPKPGDGQGTPCQYRLVLQFGEFEVADEREPNGGMGTAIPLTVVGTVELAGYHGWQRDQDFYRIDLPEVLSSLDLELDAVEDVGATLQVLDGAGARLASARGRRNERLVLRNVTLRPATADATTAARQVYVVVRTETGSNPKVRYVLRVTLGLPRLDAEVEPNDKSESATPVKDGTYSGYLPPGDVDFFRYEGEGRRDVTFQVSFPSRVRGKVESSHPDGLPAGAAETKKPRQRLVLPSIGTLGLPLFLRVSGFKGDGNANDPYTLQVSSAPSPVEKPVAPGP